MLLERRTVSRKTANDGRLEITKLAAAKCDALGAAFDIELNGERRPARLGTMDCTCRGVENPHVHHFIESDILKQLAGGDEIELDLDTAGKTIRVTAVE